MLKQKAFQALEFVHYWLRKTNIHSLHSPFLFAFHKNVIQSDERMPWMHKVDAIRQSCINSKTYIDVVDFGAGSSRLKSNIRSLSQIASYSNAAPAKARLLARLAEYVAPIHILELGTGLGFQSMYLALSIPTSTIWTFEGDPTLAKYAKKHFEEVNCTRQINMAIGDINELLPKFIHDGPIIDFAFLDANHQMEPTLSYFYLVLKKCSQNAVIVIDDIHWSEGMQKAWKEIIRHPDARITIDLYTCGVVFLNPSFIKQHWIL